MSQKYYAGIGSRTAPADVLDVMMHLARYMADAGYTLRSGGAEGSDTAFANGAGEAKEILRPKHATPEAVKIAMSLHPAPDKCNDYVRKLHGRNAQIVLGKELDTPVEIVYCWTPGGKGIGGTGMGIAIANDNKIEVKNLFDPNTMKEVKELIGYDQTA